MIQEQTEEREKQLTQFQEQMAKSFQDGAFKRPLKSFKRPLKGRFVQVLDLKLAVLAKLHSPQGLEAMEVASSMGLHNMEQFERWMSMESRTFSG